jgi:hypothetical protein
MNPPARNFKQKAHELIDQLPDAANWKGQEYEASIRQDIEEGLRDSEEGRVLSGDEVRRQFGLSN